ncbi:hypothetical protein SLS62_008697 [Diatrype stigma]|uniref:E3 ubiquitin-protein ligase n=1 Tax=Diatrype stigma TaxID=117547 RepID=A0AAN9UHC7_9PEZI
MSMLAVPDSGLQLESSAKSSNFLPLQAFGISLDDDVIEDMIKCVRGGDQIELSLGNNPSFHYGSKVQKAVPDESQYDLYLTNLDESTTKAQKLPNPTTSILKKPSGAPTKSLKSQTERAIKGSKQSGRAASSGPESDKSISGTKLGNGAPKARGKAGKAGSLLPAGKSAMATALSSNTPRSLPPSPSLNSAPSPNPAISASQQLLEKNKGQRSILVHELAARDQTYEHLQDCWMGADADLKPTLEKIANYEEASKKWSLKKLYWKELDVWSYDYDSQEDRQSAIDNAIKHYDKQRLGTTSPEWERLLAPEERGKGIILSKLQATLAKGNITPAPKISVQKTEDGGKSDADSTKPKGTSMSRSGSQSGVTKTKKVADQTKRLLSNNTKKPAAAKKPATKAKAPEDKEKRGPLSEEFVVDSDSSGEEPQPTNPAPVKPRTVEKPNKKPVEDVVEKPVEKRKESPAPAPISKPKPVVRPPRAPIKAPTSSTTKRTRDEDDSSSSSGTPLAKRIKPKEAQKPRPKAPVTAHRMSDVSQTSRSTATATATQSSNFSMKSKNTSPAKSSPLASSPPTNASDLEEHSQDKAQAQAQAQKKSLQQRNGDRTNGLSNGNSVSSAKKRKEREVELQMSNKRPRVSKDILKRATLFTRFYEKYEALHKEIVALKEPPGDKLADLLEMRERLVTMKSEISREVAANA